jgi:sugar phosphate isomerase/epimerase
MFFSGISDEAGQSIERQIAAHRALGWRHLELRNIDGVNLTTVDEATFEKIFAAVQQAEMTVCCFSSQLANWGRRITNDFSIDVNELRQAIPRMHRFGTPYIRCMSYPNDGWTDIDWRDEVVRRLRELAKMAADGGVTLVHENCDGWGGVSPQNTLELLERVNNSALKLVFDTGNTVMHHQDAPDYLRQVIAQVVHVHIKDGWHDGNKGAYTFPGDGTCQVDACVRLLRAHGYAGGYSIEPHIAAMVHTGDTGANNEAALWSSYLEYGKRFVALYERVANEG